MHLKPYLESGLVQAGVAALARLRVRGDTLVLAYHNIVPHGEQASGDMSLHLSQRAFADQLDEVARTHDVIPLASILTDHDVNPRRPRVVITFDDAYHGALVAGVAELSRRRLPATIFVAPGLLGAPTWWDILADPGSGEIPPATRDRALVEYEGDGHRILTSNAIPANADRNRSVPRIASEAELLMAATSPGIAIASHSWSHSNLSALSAEVVTGELRNSMNWLRGKCASFIPWLSYPYGKWNAATERIAADLGYAGAFRVDGGWIRRSADRRHALPRFNVPAGLSLNGFRLRLAGIAAGS